MKRSDTIEILSLAAIWGASFLFMRAGAAQFGPVALAFVRVSGAALFLMPFVLLNGHWPVLRRHWRSILLAGVTSSAIPFLCYSYAALSITASVLSIFNAATPLFGAVIAWAWLNDRLSTSRVIGLAIGFAGVLWLAWNRSQQTLGDAGAPPWTALVACIVATFGYGWSTNFTKRYLSEVPPVALSAGTQTISAACLLLPALIWWPVQPPSQTAWVAASLLAVLCTGVAFVMFFRLITRIGPANTMLVTFLIPLFAALWGWVFLRETLSSDIVLSGVIILLGTALATSIVKIPSLRPRGG